MKKVIFLLILCLCLSSCGVKSNIDQLYKENKKYVLDQEEKVWDLSKSEIKEYNQKFLVGIEAVDVYSIELYGVTTTLIAEFKSEQSANIALSQYDINFRGQYLVHQNYMFLNYYTGFAFLFGEPLTYYADNLEYYNIEQKRYIVKSSRSKKIYKIPEETEGICAFAFAEDEEIREVTFCSNMKTVGFGAFTYATALEKININPELQTIGMGAFMECNNLKNIVIPESVEYIRTNAFTSGTLFCEAKSKPKGWEKGFASDNVKVYFADDWSYDDNGNPVLVKKDKIDSKEAGYL
ncbi:MAG: leucine-rich repeat domain-containing protein [Bacilli bacterium]|nr:leucine-rich repeat domain-containing protein [Bacilli bacterium]MBQ9731309.1 leucine-rich repeat domain-containing protein [Bacilli bacterium]